MAVFAHRMTPLDFEEHHRQVVEQTFKLNRLYVAASLLGGKLATSAPTCNIVFSPKERAEALAEAEKLMADNEARKVVMP